MPPLVSVTLLNYNDRRSIFAAIDSVVRTHYPALELVLIDNYSSDGTAEEIETRIPEWEKARGAAPGWIRFIANNENIGFARGHNQAIREARGDFILCLNSDAILTSNFVVEALRPFADEKVGAVQGKLLRYDFENGRLRAKDRKAIIDTTGLVIFKNRRIVNRGQGQEDLGQYEKEEEVFGADGAVPVYRKKALDDVAIPFSVVLRPVLRGSAQNSAEAEFFDEDFFLYKEDVDLAWRLQIAGWKTIYAPRAVAYHGRGSGDSMAVNPLDIIAERRKINPAAKFYSFRNQRLMQMKNEYPSLFFRHLPWFLPKEIAAWFYVILFEGLTAPRALRAWTILMPRAIKKRRSIMSRRRASAKELLKWLR